MDNYEYFVNLFRGMQNNFDETLGQMLELYDNPEKRDKMRNDAYEFYKLHQDASYTFKDIMENIKNVI